MELNIYCSELPESAVHVCMLKQSGFANLVLLGLCTAHVTLGLVPAAFLTSARCGAFRNFLVCAHS